MSGEPSALLPLSDAFRGFCNRLDSDGTAQLLQGRLQLGRAGYPQRRIDLNSNQGIGINYCLERYIAITGVRVY